MAPIFQLSQINIYPVKSFGGIALQSALAGERGLQYDRRWMLVDEFNRFITQRENNLMAQIGVKMDEQGLYVYHKTKPLTAFRLPFAIEQSNRCTVTIFQDTCDAIALEDEINDWISEVLHQDCRFIYMPDTTKRLVNTNYAFNKETVSFADGYPFLILGEASLQSLNERLDLPVPMNRFRPNFVFSGGDAFAEDHWKEVQIGDALFRSAKKSARCVITTIDQDTGAKSAEPLHTLSQFRKLNNNVFFGQNLVLQKEGMVSVNDVVTVTTEN